MAKLSKARKAAEGKVDAEKQYALNEAMALVKVVNTAKFDASVDVHVRLGIDPRKADQALRGTVTLPHGTGKTKRVVAFVTPDKEQEALDAGADFAGLDDLVTKVNEGWTDFDVVVATASDNGQGWSSRSSTRPPWSHAEPKDGYGNYGRCSGNLRRERR